MIKIMRMILKSILALGICFAFGTCLVAVKNKMLTGFSFVNDITFTKVVSGSMEPCIMTNDEVIIRKVKNEDILEKDSVYIYNDGTKFIIHRLVDITEEGYVFMGDANEGTDKPVLRSQIVAKYEGKVDKYYKLPFQSIIIITTIINVTSLIGLFVCDELNSHRNKKKNEINNNNNNDTNKKEDEL